MKNYFHKRFEGTEKKLQQPSNKNAKIEDTINSDINGTEYYLSSTSEL